MGGGSGATRTFQSLEVLPDRNRKAHFPVCNVFFFFSFFFFFCICLAFSSLVGFRMIKMIKKREREGFRLRHAKSGLKGNETGVCSGLALDLFSFLHA